MPSRPRLSLEINWKSRFARGMPQSLSRKDYSPPPTNPRYDQETFLEYYDSCFTESEYHSNYEKYPAFSRCLRARPAWAHSASLQARREFVMSRCHTRGYSWCKIKVVFFNFNFSFIFACFGRFGGFVLAVSLVSVVSVVSFRLFRLFRSFRWFHFARFARFGGFVSAVSFRCFGF